MKRRVINLSILFVLWVFSGTCFSQDLDKDMKYFYSSFIAQSSLECKMVSKAYKPDNTVFYSQEVKLIIHDNQYYYDMGDKLYISNKHYLLWIDKTDKRVIVGKTDVSEVIKFKKQLANQMDTMSFKSMGTIIYEGEKNGAKSYKITDLTNGYIKEANITFDLATQYLKKMEFVFNTDENIGVSSSYTEFTNINASPKVNEEIFDLRPYIEVRNQTLGLTAAYKNYKLTIIDPSILDQLKN